MLSGDNPRTLYTIQCYAIYVHYMAAVCCHLVIKHRITTCGVLKAVQSLITVPSIFRPAEPSLT